MKRTLMEPACPPLWQKEATNATEYQCVSAYVGGLFVVRIHGELRASPESKRVSGALQRGIAESAGGVRVFFDLDGFIRYESQVRMQYTAAVQQNTSRVEHVYIYASSRLVKMGATVAGIVLPQLRLVSQPVFDDLLNKELALLRP